MLFGGGGGGGGAEISCAATNCAGAWGARRFDDIDLGDIITIKHSSANDTTASSTQSERVQSLSRLFIL